METKVAPDRSSFGETEADRFCPLYRVSVEIKGGRVSVPFKDAVAALTAVTEFHAHGFGAVRIFDAAGHAVGLDQLIEAADLTSRRTPLVIFANRLAARMGLPFEDWHALVMLPANQRRYETREPIIANEQDDLDMIGIIEQGFAICYKVVGDAASQPTSFSLPGDAIDLSLLFFPAPGVHVMASVPTLVSWIPRQALIALANRRPMINEALWLETLIEMKIAREWMANIGQRRGREKIGHLILEMEARFAALGAVSHGSFDLPVTQEILAAALGLSLVHYNKCLASLREEGLIVKSGRRLTLRGRPKLVALTRFDPAYLHLTERKLCRGPSVESETSDLTQVAPLADTSSGPLELSNI
jgi:CRP-like cAMP-binding protein